MLFLCVSFVCFLYFLKERVFAFDFGVLGVLGAFNLFGLLKFNCLVHPRVLFFLGVSCLNWCDCVFVVLFGRSVLTDFCGRVLPAFGVSFGVSATFSVVTDCTDSCESVSMSVSFGPFKKSSISFWIFSLSALCSLPSLFSMNIVVWIIISFLIWSRFIVSVVFST